MRFSSKKKGFFTAVLAIPVLAVTGCGASTANNSATSTANAAANNAAASGSTGAAQTIQVATINDYPPFEYVKNNKLTGFDIQLMKDIAQKEHLKISWQQMKFDGIIAALQTKQVNAAISAININAKREKVVNFSKPYFSTGNYVFVKKGSSIQSLKGLKGKTIAALQASVGLTNAKALAKKYGTKTMIVQDVTSLFLAVKSGQATGLIEDKAAIGYKNKTDPNGLVLRAVGKNLAPHQYGIAVTKNDTALLAKINNGLAAVKKDGTYQKLYKKYFGAK